MQRGWQEAQRTLEFANTAKIWSQARQDTRTRTHAVNNDPSTQARAGTHTHSSQTKGKHPATHARGDTASARATGNRESRAAKAEGGT
jgi:hypothetical protein